NAPARELAGHADRVERFGDREERAGEEAHLVAGENRHGAPGGELLGHRPRLRHARPKSVRGQFRSPAQQFAPARGGRLDRGTIRVELRQSAEEIEEERREARVALERDRAAQQGFLASTMSRGASLPGGPPSKSPHVCSTVRRACRNIRQSSSAVEARTLSRKVIVEPPRRTSISFSTRRVSSFHQRRIRYSRSGVERLSSGTSRETTWSLPKVSQRNLPPGASTRSISFTTAM